MTVEFRHNLDEIESDLDSVENMSNFLSMLPCGVDVLHTASFALEVFAMHADRRHIKRKHEKRDSDKIGLRVIRNAQQAQKSISFNLSGH